LKNYKLHHISAWSLLKIGFLIGWIASFPPIALAVTIFFRGAAALSAWLGGLVYTIRLPIPGNFGFDINVVELLKLQDFLNRLQGWAVVGILPGFLIVLVLTSLLALFWGIIAALGTAIFNLLSSAIGGIQVTLSEEAIQSDALDEISGKP
jgi:hypothetical protein